MSDERDAAHHRKLREEEGARLEAKEKLAYTIRPWDEQDDEEVALWRDYQVWER